MARRKRRRNSDVDLDLEEGYAKRRAATGDVHGTPDGGPQNEVETTNQTIDPPTKTSGGTSLIDNVEISTNSSAPVVDKIEALRRRKQERKQRQNEKKAEKKKEADTVKKNQDQMARQLADEKKQRILEKKQTEQASAAFITTRKGVQYQDIIVGKGPVVQDRRKIRVSYTLRAKHRYGKILDSSENFGFRLGRGEVIDGWDIGVQGMRQGGKRHLIVPPQAGYGNQNIGAGKGGILFFEVTVLAC